MNASLPPGMLDPTQPPPAGWGLGVLPGENAGMPGTPGSPWDDNSPLPGGGSMFTPVSTTALLVLAALVLLVMYSED